MSNMGITSIILLFLSISIHEFGHAFAMRKYKIQMEEICLLGFGPKLLSFKWRRFFGETPLCVRLIPLGAFVKPTDYSAKRMERFSYMKFGHIVGAGIAANFLFSGLLACIHLLIRSEEVTIVQIVPVIIVLLIGLFPKYSFSLMLPMGLFVGYIIISQIVTEPVKFVQESGTVVSIGKQVVEQSIDWSQTFRTAAFLSLSVGLFNCIPLVPLDGGRMGMYLSERIVWSHRRRVRTLYSAITAIPLLILILIAIKNDLVTLYHFIF